jgi:hypothetical protein
VFTRIAQKDFPDSFHLDEELAGVIAQSYLAINRGSGHKGTWYPGGELAKDHWLESMGDDPDNSDICRLLADTADAVSSWTLVTSSKAMSSATPPAAQPEKTEYLWMLGGKRIPLGFANPPPLEQLADEASSSTPSETVHNV